MSTDDTDVVFPERLQRLKHEDLFTEFDDNVLNGLYEDGEYVIDYRFDGDRSINELAIANASYSGLKLVNPKPYYKVGDVILVSVELLNGYNKRLLRGGDRVRVWIKEVRQGACAMGYVVDHRNGSYSGFVRVLWPGRVEVLAAVVLSREAVRVLYKIHREGHLVRQLFAIFQRRFMYEMTLCGPSPFLAGYSRVCNLTRRHYGLPWYCGHPEVLTCAEWTRIGGSQPPWPMLEEERKLFERHNVQQNVRSYITTEVHGRDPFTVQTPCNQIPALVTWRQTPPVGYFLNWKWRSTACTNTLPDTVRSWDLCLPWPLPSTLYNSAYNYAVFWGSHELPFTNSGEFTPLEAHKATHVYIDELPRGNRDIVIIHFYLHFTAYPPTLLRTHVRRTVQSVKALLKRAPQAKVFVKGPHSFRITTYARGVIEDYWGTIHQQILKKEFEEIQDKIYYLDFWDMSVASENNDVHPNMTLVGQMWQTLLGYICPN
ncbi:NXPE family member 3-like [Haliotis asinina]|uniref:NXPE family member 3-like n=1 Tax=Haliotis asinina TaxID=109174 RepID=UPI00353204A6